MRVKLLGAALGLAAFGAGGGWLCLLLGLCAWAALWLGHRGAPDALLSGLAGGASAGVTDYAYAAHGFMYYLRPEFDFLPVSLGVMAARGALIVSGIDGYLWVRRRVSTLVGFCAAGLVGFGLGFAAEFLGGYSGLWVWNVLWVPDWELLSVWMFVPIAWGATFFMTGYYIHRISRLRHRFPRLFRPAAVGLGCGVAWGGWMLLSYVVLLRVFGHVTIPVGGGM